jgi:hypothetical protein
MLEYFTRDQEALNGIAGPWFPPLSSDLLPVNLQLVAVTELDFVRSEQTPVSFTLHHVGQNGTRVEYLVRLVAMSTVTDWNNESELTLHPNLIHQSDGHESLDRWTNACYRNHNLVYGRQPPSLFDRETPRRPPRSLRSRANPVQYVTEQGGVWYETSRENLPDEDEMHFRWVDHRPPIGSNLVVNIWYPNELVATYFMASGVPVIYNLAIHGVYIQSRHIAEYDSEVARLLRRWTRHRSALPQLRDRACGQKLTVVYTTVLVRLLSLNRFAVTGASAFRYSG